jgi:hypothetical protein
MSDDDDRYDPDSAGTRPDSGLETSNQPGKILLAAMVKLGDSLETAFGSASSRNDVEYERARFVHALSAFSEFLRENDAPTLYSQRLHRLAIALSDLNEGKTDPLVAQSSYGSVNAGQTTAEWIGRSNAALGIAALVTTGSTRKQAATQAERATGIKTSRLLSWYDEFRKPVGKSKTTNSLARARFADLSEFIVILHGPEAQKLADHFFKRATEELQKQT